MIHKGGHKKETQKELWRNRNEVYTESQEWGLKWGHKEGHISGYKKDIKRAMNETIKKLLLREFFGCDFYWDNFWSNQPEAPNKPTQAGCSKNYLNKEVINRVIKELIMRAKRLHKRDHERKP
jgi:hypothetical protein